MPMILGMGGNVGSQSVALIVRGIATGRVTQRYFLNIIARQVGVGALMGVVYGLMLGLISMVMYPDYMKMALVVTLSIFNSMTLAALVGTVLPILFFKLGKDPAVASGPFMSSVMDLIGVIAYFSIATWLLF